MKTLKISISLLATVACAMMVAGCATTKQAVIPSEVKFTMHRVDKFRSEACGVADFNGDGKPDIFAGEFLYLAPDFKPVKVRTIAGSVDENGKGYRNDFANATSMATAGPTSSGPTRGLKRPPTRATASGSNTLSSSAARTA
ncbi:MAG: hypothetical protein NTY01_12685 [Verrucomicrobia bacterium]|nr:hypothetical protein [Verrucomicrobiota bacterium]